MSVQKIHFDQIQETLYYEKLDNGLDVYVLPKEGFSKTYATFTTKYGSIDQHFIPPGLKETKVPDGIAHFLEHKMFEEEDGDIFHEFGKYGASANAFTSFDRTAYLFSCTDHVSENLNILLNFVQNPYFTHENVEKEKGITEQEIRMYQDNPDWRVQFGLFRSFYHHHPLKIDIAGTVESIYEIDKDMLYTCYETFYHPSNMVLFVVGAIDPNQILDQVRENQNSKPFKEQDEIERIFQEEPSSVASNLLEIELGVGVPKCMMGYKEAKLGLQGKDLLKQELMTSLILDMILGPSSNLIEEMVQEGIIDDSFGSDYTLEKSYGFSSFGGNSKDPQQLIERIQEHIAVLREQGLHQADFERSRKKTIGAFLKSLNSPEFIANQFTRYQFNQMNLFDVISTLEEIQFADTQSRLEEHFHPEHFAACIVR